MESFNFEKPKNENSLLKKAKNALMAGGIALSAAVPMKSNAQTRNIDQEISKFKIENKKITKENFPVLYDSLFENIIANYSHKEKNDLALAMANSLYEKKKEDLNVLIKQIDHTDNGDYSDENRDIKNDYPDIKIKTGRLVRTHYTHNTVHFDPSFRKVKPTSKDTFELLIAEIPHYIQEKKYGWLKLNTRAFLDLMKYGDGKNYSTPGTIENEAHSVIEPELMQKYNYKKLILNEDEKKQLDLLEKYRTDIYKIHQGQIDLDKYICDTSLDPFFKSKIENFFKN